MGEIVQLQRVHRQFALAAQGEAQADDHTVSTVTNNWYPTPEMVMEYEGHIVNDPDNAPGVKFFIAERTTIIREIPVTHTAGYGGTGVDDG